jgi:hypothetical protein
VASLILDFGCQRLIAIAPAFPRARTKATATDGLVKSVNRNGSVHIASRLEEKTDALHLPIQCRFAGTGSIVSDNESLIQGSSTGGRVLAPLTMWCSVGNEFEVLWIVGEKQIRFQSPRRRRRS